MMELLKPTRRFVVSMELLRMVVWALSGVVLYSCSVLLGSEYPQAQVVLYKLGHVTILSWVGYWVARMALGRINHEADATFALALVARAILMAGVILAGSTGL